MLSCLSSVQVIKTFSNHVVAKFTVKMKMVKSQLPVMLLQVDALTGASARKNLNSRINEVTDEPSDSESEELSDYMSDEENTSESGKDDKKMEDSNLLNSIWYHAENTALAESTNRSVIWSINGLQLFTMTLFIAKTAEEVSGGQKWSY